MRIVDEIRESALIAWGSVRANKLRSALTMLGVVIGVITVTLMGTAINGINHAFRQSISSLGADVLFVSRFGWLNFRDWRLLRNRKEITLADVREVERSLTTALAVAPQADGRGTVIYNRRRVSGVWIAGNSDQSIVTRGLTLAQGRWLTPSDVDSARYVCIIGDYIAEGFFPRESPLGKRIRVNNASYEVVGVLAKQGNFLGQWNQDSQVVIPVTRFQFDQTRRPDYSVSVKAADPGSVAETVEEVRAVMRRIRKVPPGMPDDFAINQQDVFIKFFVAFGGTIGLVGLFITGLSLIVGGIGIMNIMFVSVTERTREIGVRKALGAKKRTILIQFLIEAVTITLSAGLFAVAIAWPTTIAVRKFANFPAEMSWWIVAISLVVSVLTGAVAGFIPALRAARMDPVEALRSE